MRFDNGFKISVQWGTMNYCERKNLMADYRSELENPEHPSGVTESQDAEIAVIGPEDEMLGIGEHDQVIGWLSPDEVAKVITIVSSSKTDNEIKLKIKSLNLS